MICNSLPCQRMRLQGNLCQAVQRCNEECSRADRYMKCISLPDSILLRIVLEHFKKASSTFSPVSALVSKNINSEEKIIGIRYIHTHCYLNDYSFTATLFTVNKVLIKSKLTKAIVSLQVRVKHNVIYHVKKLKFVLQ